MGSIALPNTLGRGVCRFKKSGSDTYIDLGSASAVTFTPATENTEHIGLRTSNTVIDDYVNTLLRLEVKVELENSIAGVMALFAMASGVTDVSQTGASVVDEDATAKHDEWIATSKQFISSVVITDAAGTTTYTAGDDYKVDARGYIYIFDDGAITDNQALKIDYTYATQEILKFVGGSDINIEGHFLFEGDPVKGARQRFYARTTLRPDGDFSLVSQGEFQKFSLAMTALFDSEIGGMYDFRLMGTVGTSPTA